MTDNIRQPQNVKIVCQIYLDANILKRQEIEDQLQWTTSRNWPMANRLVTQSMSSRDLIKRGHVGCSENVMALDRLRVRTNVILLLMQDTLDLYCGDVQS